MAIVPPPYKRENEPAWHRPNNIRKLSGDLALSNAAAILTGLARGGASINDLIQVRNYFAHRNEDTAATVRTVLYRHAITPKYSVEDSVCQRVPASSAILLELWLSDLAAAIDLMAR